MALHEGEKTRDSGRSGGVSTFDRWFGSLDTIKTDIFKILRCARRLFGQCTIITLTDNTVVRSYVLTLTCMTEDSELFFQVP